MIGCIIGDIVGSMYEAIPVKHKEFALFPEGCGFTDDTVLTVAVAESLMTGGDLVTLFHDYFRRYPNVGYGKTFGAWAKVRDRDPYNSWGNGSAMRVAPVGWYHDTLPEVLATAARTSAVTHDHQDGIRAAQAVAGAVFLARTGADKAAIKTFCAQAGGYDLDRTLDAIRPAYKFEVYAIYSVPQAIIAFLESTSYEDAIRNAVSLGGDADTQACIAGGIAEAFYGGVPEELHIAALARLDRGLINILAEFHGRHVKPRQKTG